MGSQYLPEGMSSDYDIDRKIAINREQDEFWRLKATIAEQAATIERFREYRRAVLAYEDRDVAWDSADERIALAQRLDTASAAITAADMGDAE